MSARTGFYWQVTIKGGITATGEIAPLPGISQETIKKACHDLDEINKIATTWALPQDKKALIDFLRKESLLRACCSSVRFGVESAIMELIAKAQGITLVDFLEGSSQEVFSAYLLQGTNMEILKDAKQAVELGQKVFKLKVGNRNIVMDVKNVLDLRALVGKELVLRLDANRVWSMEEALLFVQSIGHDNIDYIEEPISKMDRLGDFYEQVHMPIALDETLALSRCDAKTPGRCMPTLANHDGVKAYCIKPVVVGGVIASLDWIAQAKQNGKRAIVSSCFETPIGFNMVNAIASLSSDVAGLGTQRFYE